jgi:sortase A
MKTIDPIGPTFQLPTDPPDDTHSSDAANLVRSKIDTLFTSEPDVVTEAIESIQKEPLKRSKHQKFMADLSASGKPFATIQMEWHEYYQQLPDNEKHQVWEEFYSSQQHKPVFASQTAQPTINHQPAPFIQSDDTQKDQDTSKTKKPQSIADIKKQITGRVQNRAKLSPKQHFKSLAFGLGMGSIVVVILLFGFFNERFLAPFITPSRSVSSTPLILDAGATVGQDSRIIIPKINVEVPVVYDVATIEEAAIQSGLERGVVHYPTTSNPGEQGNGAIFGHSSNNILNKGKYKFAFVLLSRLEINDTFYIEKGGVRYVYKIFDKKVVPPTEVSVLEPVAGKTSTMALITCDPPGTNINRLVVYGEQISPDPNKNIASTAVQTDVQTEQLAGNPQSLWSRIWGSIF